MDNTIAPSPPLDSAAGRQKTKPMDSHNVNNVHDNNYE